ncbi:MAG: hypothetical protein HDKAJFGB_03314 [Anaerolineae bacterium]|nr:hypothetical protein [Anaerolineae bacterium]MDL1896711.1 hypothetical protein [Anaerolineae bacterium CFX7]
MKSRPIPVTILAVLSAIAAVFAGIHLLQSLGILPYVIGDAKFRNFNLWYAFMWGLMVWVWVWLFQMLWRVDKSAWLFLAVISAFNLILGFTALLGSGTQFSDVSVTVIVNGLILAYCLLPGTKEAFGV